MKLILSISLGFLFLLKGLGPGMDLSCELQKLPNLFIHYQEHKACNNNSFLSFLLHDFLDFDGDSEHPRHDETGHEDLPFHGTHECCHTSVFYVSDEFFSVMALKYQYAAQAEFAFYRSSYSSEFLYSFFQPPQV